MINRFLGYFFGKIKLVFYKLLYPKRLYYKKRIYFNNTSNFYIEKGCKVILGKNFKCRKNLSIYSIDKGNLTIGDNAVISDNCFISSQKNIKIGDNFLLGNNSTIIDNDHDYASSLKKFKCEDIIIGNNVWCGCNVVILKGVTIGDNCVIAAGTIVNKDIPSNSLVYQKKDLVIKSIKK